MNIYKENTTLQTWDCILDKLKDNMKKGNTLSTTLDGIIAQKIMIKLLS